MQPKLHRARGEKPEIKVTSPSSAHSAASPLDQLIDDYVADVAEVIAAREAAIKKVLRDHVHTEKHWRKTK